MIIKHIWNSVTITYTPVYIYIYIIYPPPCLWHAVRVVFLWYWFFCWNVFWIHCRKSRQECLRSYVRVPWRILSRGCPPAGSIPNVLNLARYAHFDLCSKRFRHKTSIFTMFFVEISCYRAAKVHKRTSARSSPPLSGLESPVANEHRSFT